MNKDTRKNIIIVDSEGKPIKRIEAVWFKSFDGECLTYLYYESGVEYEVAVYLNKDDIGGVLIQEREPMKNGVE